MKRKRSDTEWNGRRVAFSAKEEAAGEEEEDVGPCGTVGT